MGYKVIFSPLNPYRALEADKVFNSQYGYPHPRKVSFIDSLTNEDDSTPYFQPCTYDQVITIVYDRMIEGTNYNYALLNFYDIDGNYLGNMDEPSVQQYVVPNNLDLETGEQLYTDVFIFKPSDFAFLNGQRIVTMQLSIAYGEVGAPTEPGLVRRFNFDPIVLAQEHKGTSLLKYGNNYNLPGTWFEIADIYPQFMIRTEAKRLIPEPAGDYTSYTEQSGNLVMLDGDSYDVYPWHVIAPPHVLSIINRALVECEYKNIDGSDFVLESAADGYSGTRTMQLATHKLRDRTDTDPFVFNEVTFDLWEQPASGFPYGIGHVTLYDGYNYFASLPQVFNDASDVTAFLTIVQNALPTYGSNGTVINAAGKVSFTNADGEQFGKLYEVQVYPTYYQLEVNVSTIDTSLRYMMKYDLGDVRSHLFIEGTDAGQATRFASSGSNNEVNVISPEFDSTGDKSVRIFHQNYERDITFAVSVFSNPNSPLITDISGDMSTRLQKLSISRHNFTALATLDISFLAAAKNTLHTLEIIESNLRGLTANWASSLIVGGIKPFRNLYIVRLVFNLLNSAAVDAIIKEYHDDVDWSAGAGKGIYLYQAPTYPSAPPSGAVATEIANLQAGLYTVSTD